MGNQELCLLVVGLLFVIRNKQFERENTFHDRLNKMNYHEVNSLESQKTQLIVASKEIDELLKKVGKKGYIKYQLPMIQSCVVEIDKEEAGVIMETKKDQDVIVEMDSVIKAQMKRASKIIKVGAAYEEGYFGQNIGVAVLDTGVAPHPDLVSGGNRIVAFVDFINRRRFPYDDNGHGTHVSGIIAGNGTESDGEYMGVAPKANIIGVKVLNHKGNGNVTDVLAGLQWVIDHKETYNIRVVNISVGTASNDSIDETSMLVKGVNAVWDAGIVVVVAAGNNGPKPKSISTPGISRKVITVGASDDDIPVDLSGEKSKDYSGRGPTNACIKKPDVVAPGSQIVSCNVINKQGGVFAFRQNSTNFYTEKSGTSMSTPIVSGAMALLLSKYPEYTTRDVKMKLKESCDDLGQPHGKQGWGRLNVAKLLQE